LFAWAGESELGSTQCTTPISSSKTYAQNRLTGLGTAVRRSAWKVAAGYVSSKC